jgi:hypothetical protein
MRSDPEPVPAEEKIDSKQLFASDDRSVDLAIDGSFPASDPPPWTLGTSRDANRLPEHSTRAIQR